jgi:hypothetical protein
VLFRSAVVTATSGSARQSLNLPIINTKLTYSGATTSTLGSTLVMNFTATDSKGVVIPGVVLSLSSALGNGLPATVTTDATGQATVSYTATRSGADTVGVSGAGAALSVALTITGSDEDLSFTTPAASTKVPVGQVQTLTVRYRKAGVAQAGTTINLAATIGSFSASSVVSSTSVVTDANGQASVTLRSGFAGSSVVSATVANAHVQATLPLNFVATVPATLVLQVTPSALAPNLNGSTSNQATLVARVTDANGNPVADKAVSRSEERRVGKECRRLCRSRWSPYH